MAGIEAGRDGLNSDNFAQFTYDPGADVLTVRALTDFESRQAVERYAQKIERLAGIDYTSDSTCTRVDIQIGEFLGRDRKTHLLGGTASQVLGIVDRVSQEHKDTQQDAKLLWLPGSGARGPSVLVYPDFQLWLEDQPEGFSESMDRARHVLNGESQGLLGSVQRAVGAMTAAMARHAPLADESIQRRHSPGRIYVGNEYTPGTAFHLARRPEVAREAGDRPRDVDADVTWNTLCLTLGGVAVCEPTSAKERLVRIGSGHNGLYRMETTAGKSAEQLRVALVLGTLARESVTATTQDNDSLEALLQDVRWYRRALLPVA